MEINQIDVRQRIREIKDSKFMNQSEFAEAIGIKQGDLSSYLSGKRPIGISLINRIIIAFTINKAWLLTGEGDMYTCAEGRTVKEGEKQKDSETVKELMAAIKRRDEHVEALIRVNEKHADNFAELLRQMKKTDAPKEYTAGCAGVAGGEIEK